MCIRDRTYGGAGTLLVTVAKETGTGAVNFQWYKVEDGNATAVGSATTKNQFDLSALKLPAGQHTFRFSATCDGYKKMSQDIAVTVQKASISASFITPPTAQENLTYTGQEQALITAGSVTSGGTMQYSLTENGTYSQDIPTGTDAGAYTVWYRVIGDANHNDTTPASVAVSIGKKPLTLSGVTAASKPYDGTTNADISSVTFDNSENSDSFYYNSDTMSAIYPSRTSEGLTYTETGIMPTVPTDKQIAKTDAAAISQPKAEDVPDCVDKLATAIAGGQSKGGEAAQALAEKLKESGWFSHGLSGDYPSTAGHGNYRIDQLLAGTAMVGDSEQYASAMALMARSLGLPSRVVLGFLPKDDEGEISESRTEEQGTTTITKFTGNDVTAWVEIKLDGYGWVAFYPTPKETKVPDENQNLTPPNPQTLVRQPPVPLTDPLRDDTQAKGKSSIGGSMADETSANLFWQHFGRIARKVAIYGSPLWTLLIICGLLLAIKAIALACLLYTSDAADEL